MPIGVYKRPSLEARLERWSTPEPNTGCLLWLGALQGGGYGVITVDGKTDLAHRVAYVERVGPIPDGMELDHLCRVKSCIEGRHLEAVTPKVNVGRCESPCGRNARKLHCLRGHEFTEANTYPHPNGGRACRTCQRQRNIEFRDRKESKCA